MNLKLVERQTNRYKRKYPKYKRYANTLEELLKKIAKKNDIECIVSTRPKAISSFAEKVVRKSHKYKDPVNQLTDLCGGRVITQTQSEVTEFCNLVEQHFLIDRENSVGVEDRLKPTEFGYRSVHYIIQLDPDFDYLAEYGTKIPVSVFGLFAEIQVRTLLEHAWADLYHKWVYKNEFEIPDKMQREMAGIAARLEAADNSFSGVQEELKDFYSSYGAYLDKEQSRDEITKLEITLKYDPDNLSVVRQIGRLYLATEDWDSTISILTPFEKREDPIILRYIGLALCKKHEDNRESAPFSRGQKLLEKAGSPPHNNSDALSSLAGSWKGLDEEKAVTYFRKAFEMDPTDSYPLGNYLESEIIKDEDLSIIGFTRPVIEKAINRSNACIQVGVNIPWAWFDIGKLNLFLKQPYDSLSAFIKGIDLSLAAYMPRTFYDSLIRLSVVSGQFPGFTWMEKLFLLGLAGRFKGEEELIKIRKIASSGSIPSDRPVVILAGGSSSEVEQKMRNYLPRLKEAFEGVSCTLISGGTSSGISRLAGDLKELHPDDIHTIGYLPISKKNLSDTDKSRYDEIRLSDGDEFSPLEPILYWIDLLASGVDPKNVRLLAIHGGRISKMECILALMMGAWVGIPKDGRGEPGLLLKDKDWCTSENLLELPEDPAILTAFINSLPGEEDPKIANIREELAEAIHEQYRKTRIENPTGNDPAMKPWKELDEKLQHSNRYQADQIYEKLKLINCGVREVKDREVAIMKFTNKEVEQMAEMEHARWTVERLAKGWKPAPKKDVARKLSPYLLIWDELDEGTKDYDRQTVENIPTYLAAVNLEVYRL